MSIITDYLLMFAMILSAAAVAVGVLQESTPVLFVGSLCLTAAWLNHDGVKS